MQHSGIPLKTASLVQFKAYKMDEFTDIFHGYLVENNDNTEILTSFFT